MECGKVKLTVTVKRWGVFVLLWRAIREGFDIPWYHWHRAVLVYLRMCLKVMLCGWEKAAPGDDQ